MARKLKVLFVASECAPFAKNWRSRRRRGSAAQGLGAAGHRCPRRHPALRRHKVGRPRRAGGCAQGGRTVLAKRAAPCASVTCRGVRCRSIFSSTSTTSIASIFTVRPKRIFGQHRALHVPLARRARALQSVGLHPRHHPRQRLAGGAGSRLREHRGMVEAAPRRGHHLHHSQLGLPGRVDGGALFITGLGASTTTRTSSSISDR